ncbi:MAG: TonB-dependent receptor [Bacteroidetes bacterium]|nr:TonB-dependent receptor [Bacteroidota bacterium]
MSRPSMRLVYRFLPLLAASTSAAYAQTPDTASVRAEEIVVTTLRERTSLGHAPLSVTVVSPSVFAGGRAAGLDEALRGVPGVLAQSRSGGVDVRLSVRGFGARGAGDRSNAGTSRGLKVLVDGIPETEPDGRTAFDLVDLDAVTEVQVVRTNASALWGNAAGGLLVLRTEPEGTAPFVEGRIATGTFGFRKLSARANARLGDGHAWAFVSQTDLDGWRANSQMDRTLVLAGASAALGARTKLTATAAATQHRFGIPGPLSQAQYDADPQQANPTYLARRERRNNQLARVGLRLAHQDLNGGEWNAVLFAQPKYLQRSERGTYRDFSRGHVGGSASWQHGWAAGSGRLTTVVGTDAQFQDGAAVFYALSPSQGRSTTIAQNKAEGALASGGFGQIGWSQGRFDLVGGLRYDAVRYDYRDYRTPVLDTAVTFTAVTPRLGATFRAAPGLVVFAALGGGVEVPAGNETDPASTFGQDLVTAINPLLSPIQSTTVELGTRFDRTMNGALRRVRADAAAYVIDVRNDIVPYRGGRFYFTAGKTRRLGVETSARLSFAGGLDLAGALTLSNNEYVRYTVDSVHYGKPGKVADYAGNAVAGVPGAFYNAELRFAPPVAHGLFGRFDVQGVSAYMVDDANAVEVPAYTVLNAAIGTEHPLRLAGGLGVGAQLSVQNVLDTKYVGSAFVNPDVVSGVPVYLEPGLPRSVTLSVSFRWDAAP